LLLLFAVSVLLPGLILAYLSFRSVKDENLLIEKSMDTRYQSFADAVSQTLRKTRQLHFEELSQKMRDGGSAETPEGAWSLAAHLLENPMVQSLAVFHGDTAVFPRTPESAPPTVRDMNEYPSDLVATVRQEWRTQHYAACLRAVRLLLHGPDSLTHTQTRFGFRLLELKCLINLNETGEAVTAAHHFTRDLLETREIETPHLTGFYLNETVGLMTSLEKLPRDAREEFFSLHQHLPLFLANADRVAREWPSTPEDLLSGQADISDDSLRVSYQEGIPYLRIGYPWVSRGTQVLLRLNEGVFVEALRSEITPDKRSAWRDVDFALLNLHDEPVFSSEGPSDREAALERSYEEEFPAWRLIVYKKPASELMSIGRRRAALQYILLGFSLLALLVGTFTLFGGLNKERHTVKMKSNFLSAVSHELKTPLTAIRMFAEMLATGRQAQEEKRQQYAHRIGEEAERLQGMIEGILNYTRLEEKPDALRFRDVDLSTVAGETATLLSGAFAQAGIRLTVQLAPTAPLRADYDALRSVAQNLLENALKYSRPHTEVTLEVLDFPREAVLRVADQGIGIPTSEQKRIFERFYRAGDEMTRKARGSGLGLALVKKIVDAHRGAIKVNSKVNEGTEMIITFPKETAAHAPDTRG
jgi:signal transduction histidine kinase